jgi:hypothetical protein
LFLGLNDKKLIIKMGYYKILTYRNTLI